MSGHPYRSPDPHFSVAGGIVVRRLAPDSRKLDIRDETTLQRQMLMVMGGEIGNVHAASAGAGERIAADLERRGGGWLAAAVDSALRRVRDDHAAWRDAVQEKD